MADQGGAAECPTCGRPLDLHDRHIRYRLPSPVLATEEREATPGTWMSHGTPEESVMMQVPGVGPFVRCLLPIRLSGGHRLTLGVWMAVHPSDLQRAFALWWEPEYPSLVLEGLLANDLPLGDVLGAPVAAKVLDPDHTPYLTASPNAELDRMLHDEWGHDAVLAAFEG